MGTVWVAVGAVSCLFRCSYLRAQQPGRGKDSQLTMDSDTRTDGDSGLNWSDSDKDSHMAPRVSARKVDHASKSFLRLTDGQEWTVCSSTCVRAIHKWPGNLHII